MTDMLSKLLTLETALEHLSKQGTGSHIPREKRYYHEGGKYTGPQGGKFSEIGVDVDSSGNPMQQPTQAPATTEDLAPGAEREIEVVAPAEDKSVPFWQSHGVLGGGTRELLHEMSLDRTFDTITDDLQSITTKEEMFDYLANTLESPLTSLSQIAMREDPSYGVDISKYAALEYSKLIEFYGYSKADDPKDPLRYASKASRTVEPRDGIHPELLNLNRPLLDHNSYEYDLQEWNEEDLDILVDSRKKQIAKYLNPKDQKEFIEKESLPSLFYTSWIGEDSGVERLDASNIHFENLELFYDRLVDLMGQIERPDDSTIGTPDIHHPNRVFRNSIERIVRRAATSSEPWGGDLLTKITKDLSRAGTVESNKKFADVVKNLNVRQLAFNFVNPKLLDELLDNSNTEYMQFSPNEEKALKDRKTAYDLLGGSQLPELFQTTLNELQWDEQGHLQLQEGQTLLPDYMFSQDFNAPGYKSNNLKEILHNSRYLIAGQNPTADVVKAFDELYKATPYGPIHALTKSEWESSSSSPGGAILKHIVGDLYDGDVVFNEGVFDPDDIARDIEEAYRDYETDLGVPRNEIKKYVQIHKQLTRELLDIAFPDTDDFELFRGVDHEDLAYDMKDRFGEEPDDRDEIEDLRNDLSGDELEEFEEEMGDPYQDNPHFVRSFDSNFNDITGLTSENPLTSWSLDYRAAKKFASDKDDGVILRSKVNKDEIWSSFLTHAYDGNEREILTINDPQRFMVGALWEHLDRGDAAGAYNDEVLPVRGLKISSLIDSGQGMQDLNRLDSKNWDQMTRDRGKIPIGRYIQNADDDELDIVPKHMLDDEKNADWMHSIKKQVEDTNLLKDIDEERDYDPKGFHVGPRKGHYFKPGEREAGGKQVEIVQPDKEVEVDSRTKTARKWKTTTVANWVIENVDRDTKILDFGSGLETQFRRLQAIGEYAPGQDPDDPNNWSDVAPSKPFTDVHSYDIERPDSKVKLDHTYDLVMASNVLNVQETDDQLTNTLKQLEGLLAPGGHIIANVPKSGPRKLIQTTGEMEARLKEHFGEENVKTVKGDNHWLISSPGSKERADEPWNLTKRQFNRQWVWHNTSSNNAFQISREKAIKRGVFGIGGKRDQYPGDVTIYARRSDIESLSPTLESFGRGQALYPKGTYSPTHEWETPLSTMFDDDSPRVFFVPKTMRGKKVDAYEYLKEKYAPIEEEEEEEIVYPVLGGGITGVVDLKEQINTEDYFQLQPLGQDRDTLLPGQDPPDQVHWGQSMPRYFYHKPPPDVREGSEDKGIKAYTPAHKEMTPFKEGVVWMSHSKPLTAGENVTSVTDERINPNDTNVRVVDVTKLERSNLHIANDGHLQHKGDVPFDAIVDIEQASDMIQKSLDGLSKLRILEQSLNYLIMKDVDEPKDYDPKGFHEGPRHGRYFKPGEREAGGKEIDIVQAPEAKTEEVPEVATLREDDAPRIYERKKGLDSSYADQSYSEEIFNPNLDRYQNEVSNDLFTKTMEIFENANFPTVKRVIDGKTVDTSLWQDRFNELKDKYPYLESVENLRSIGANPIDSVTADTDSRLQYIESKESDLTNFQFIVANSLGSGKEGEKTIRDLVGKTEIPSWQGHPSSELRETFRYMKTGEFNAPKDETDRRLRYAKTSTPEELRDAISKYKEGLIKRSENLKKLVDKEHEVWKDYLIGDGSIRVYRGVDIHRNNADRESRGEKAFELPEVGNEYKSKDATLTSWSVSPEKASKFGNTVFARTIKAEDIVASFLSLNIGGIKNEGEIILQNLDGDDAVEVDVVRTVVRPPNVSPPKKPSRRLESEEFAPIYRQDTDENKSNNLSKLVVLETALEHLFKVDPEYRDYDPKGFHEGPRHGKYFKPGEREAGGKEVEVVQAPEAKTETDSTVELPETATLREEFVTDPETGRMKGVPRTSSGEPPTHVFRVMDKRQYDDAVDRGSLRAVSPDKGGDGRIYAAGGPRFQFGVSSPTVLVAIEYSDDDGWRARWSHTGPDLSGEEVSVAVDSPPYSIDMSKVKLIAEGANGRELSENYKKLRPELQDVQDPDDEEDGQVADPHREHSRGGKVMAEVMEGLRQHTDRLRRQKPVNVDNPDSMQDVYDYQMGKLEPLTGGSTKWPSELQSDVYLKGNHEYAGDIYREIAGNGDASYIEGHLNRLINSISTTEDRKIWSEPLSPEVHELNEKVMKLVVEAPERTDRQRNAKALMLAVVNRDVEDMKFFIPLVSENTPDKTRSIMEGAWPNAATSYIGNTIGRQSLKGVFYDLEKNVDENKFNNLSKLVILEAALDHLLKQDGTGSHVPREKRYYHPEGKYQGPRGGKFSEIGVDVDQRGKPLKTQDAPVDELQPGQAREIDVIAPDSSGLMAELSASRHFSQFSPEELQEAIEFLDLSDINSVDELPDDYFAVSVPNEQQLLEEFLDYEADQRILNHVKSLSYMEELNPQIDEAKRKEMSSKRDSDNPELRIVSNENHPTGEEVEAFIGKVIEDNSSTSIPNGTRENDGKKESMYPDQLENIQEVLANAFDGVGKKSMFPRGRRYIADHLLKLLPSINLWGERNTREVIERSAAYRTRKQIDSPLRPKTRAVFEEKLNKLGDNPTDIDMLDFKETFLDEMLKYDYNYEMLFEAATKSFQNKYSNEVSEEFTKYLPSYSEAYSHMPIHLGGFVRPYGTDLKFADWAYGNYKQGNVDKTYGITEEELEHFKSSLKGGINLPHFSRFADGLDFKTFQRMFSGWAMNDLSDEYRFNFNSYDNTFRNMQDHGNGIAEIIHYTNEDGTRYDGYELSNAPRKEKLYIDYAAFLKSWQGGVALHEFGHVIEHQLIKDKSKIDPELPNRSHWRGVAANVVAKAYKESQKNTTGGDGKYRIRETDFVPMSRYGMSKPAEFFAECACAYFMDTATLYMRQPAMFKLMETINTHSPEELDGDSALFPDYRDFKGMI